MEVTVITNIRRKVLTMVSKMAYDGNLPDHVYDVLQIVNENTPRTRCCVHKERAVLKERICVALGVNEDMNIIDAANKATTDPARDRCAAGSLLCLPSEQIHDHRCVPPLPDPPVHERLPQESHFRIPGPRPYRL